ncbi:MAG: site-specific integrase [Planctomycetaceae bacterium]|jgi:integrase|nr:site-specific integrase [Planctomycetaceae bacterium]MBT6485391.1 site-specific integrase [Planctomycetaceae bacterium]MBT6494345.1 site-specific integrase [Planctomycetaceae bacterium]
MACTKKKPPKPYKDFPLFPHASGQWAKKIRGRLFYFGIWADHESALKKYLANRDYLQAGVDLPDDTDQTCLANLCNRFLAAKQNRVDSGELRLATWQDYKRTCGLIIDALGRNRVVDTIGPADFTRLRGVITSRFGPVRTSREITQVRMLFKWGHQQELTSMPRYGSEFVKPSRDVLRRHRQSSPPKMFEAAEIRAMLETARIHTKAWILLGINCAFIQRDVSDLTIRAVDLHKAVIDFPRGKTAIERRAPLWPETVDALKESLANPWTPRQPEEVDHFFVTRQGNELVRDHRSETRSDAVHDALERVQKKLEIKRVKRSFGALRHTFRTIADETCDFPAILRIMGHSDHSISDHYRERISDDRLNRVVGHVREWLFQT